MRPRQNSDRIRGIKSEKKAAKKYQGKVQPASGATWHSKQDILVQGKIKLLIQNKDTQKKSYSVKIKELDALEKDALLEDAKPIFRVQFSKDSKSYIIIPEWFMDELRDKYV